jgi:hypothetical protein
VESAVVDPVMDVFVYAKEDYSRLGCVAAYMIGILVLIYQTIWREIQVTLSS